MNPVVNRFSATKQQGFTLIEMLVALVVLSVGFVGVAGLQLVSLRNGQDSIARSSSSFMAYSLIEAIHANSQDAASFASDWKTSVPDCDSALATVNGELNCFYNRVMTELPAGNAKITFDNSTANKKVTIEISWLDKESKQTTAATNRLIQQKWVVSP